MSSRIREVARLLHRNTNPPPPPMVKRTSKVRDVATTVQAINFKKPSGDLVKTDKETVKGRGAWRYPNGVIQRAPSTVMPSGKEYFDPRDPALPRRKIESNFFITLNTNKVILDGDFGINREALVACQQATDALATDELVCTYLKFGPKDDSYGADEYHDVITRVEWEGKAEVGEKQFRLHAHIWMTIYHYSQVQINMPLMQAAFKEQYNLRAPKQYKITRRPYIQVKLLPTSDWAEVIKNYIRKGMNALEAPPPADLIRLTLI